jgi:hypothetical protein
LISSIAFALFTGGNSASPERTDRLYQVEGNAFVAGGQAEVDAMRFQQSLDLT